MTKPTIIGWDMGATEGDRTVYISILRDGQHKEVTKAEYDAHIAKALADLVTRMERRITELEIKMDLRTKPTSAEINKAQEDFIKRMSPDPKPDDRLDLVTPTRWSKP